MEFSDEDRTLAERLLAERSPEDIAAALVNVHRSRLPQPEELLGNDAPRENRGPRPGFEDSVWFKVNIGRNQNADPRWILPLLCRRGHVGRGEIGAIRIDTRETHFEVPGAIADRFLDAVQRTAGGDDEVEIERSNGAPPPNTSRPRHRDGGRSNAPRKPFKGAGKGPGKGPGTGGPSKPFHRKGPPRKKPGREG